MAPSQEIPLPELDLWGLPPVQKSVLTDISMEQRPSTTVSWGSAIEFDFILGQDEYMLFSETYLYMKIQPHLKKSDKSEIATTAEQSAFIPANYLLHAMIDKVTITIGSTPNAYQTQKYAYKAYLEACLGYSAEARKSHLSSSLWNDDEEIRRKSLFYNTSEKKGPKTFELKGRLHVDFTHQNRAIVGGSRVRITLTLNKPKFFMMHPKGSSASFDLLEAVLCVHRMQVAPKIVTAHCKALASSNAKYPMTRTAVFHQLIPANSQYLHMDRLVTGQSPRRIFFALVDSRAFNGDSTMNPYKFEPFGLSYIVCFKDGQMIPRNGYSMDYEEGLYVDAYVGLIQTLNQNGTDSYAAIDMNSFAKDKCIYGFNLCPDLSNGSGMVGYISDTTDANIRFDLKFSEPVQSNLTAVIFAEYDTVSEITSDRQLITSLTL